MSVTESHPEKRFVLPAEYYSTATPAPRLPAWLKLGCGGLSLVALVIVFAGGAYLSSGGMTDLMDMVLGMTAGEMRPLYTKDVPDSQKAALESELDALRKGLKDGRVSVQRLDPLLQSMRRATADSRVEPAEVDAMLAAARKVSATPAVRK
jgi:hypothetical protein